MWCSYEDNFCLNPCAWVVCVSLPTEENMKNAAEIMIKAFEIALKTRAPKMNKIKTLTLDMIGD